MLTEARSLVLVSKLAPALRPGKRHKPRDLKLSSLPVLKEPCFLGISLLRGYQVPDALNKTEKGTQLQSTASFCGFPQAISFIRYSQTQHTFPLLIL